MIASERSKRAFEPNGLQRIKRPECNPAPLSLKYASIRIKRVKGKVTRSMNKVHICSIE